MAWEQHPEPACRQEHATLPDDLRRVPAIAWPTLALAAFGLTLFVGTHVAVLSSASPLVSITYANSTDSIPSEVRVAAHVTEQAAYWKAVAVLALSAFLCFTPMHDASHMSIAKRPLSWVNGAVGHACGLPLGAPFGIFTHLHLEHHKYTNYDGGLDPDRWTGGGRHGYHPVTGLLLLPLRCLLIVLVAYVSHYLSIVPRRPRREAIPGILTILTTIAVPGTVWLWAPQYDYLFWFYFVPAQLGAALLGLTFDYLPHRPHADTRIHHATSVVSLVEDPTPGAAEPHWAHVAGVSALTVPLLGQNYHLVHHLWPFLPFYKYSAVYWRLRRELEARGARTRALLPLIVSRSTVDADADKAGNGWPAARPPRWH